jgi:hypothetical protein
MARPYSCKAGIVPLGGGYSRHHRNSHRNAKRSAKAHHTVPMNHRKPHTPHRRSGEGVRDRDQQFDDDEPRGPPNGEPQGNPNGSPYRTDEAPKSAHTTHQREAGGAYTLKRLSRHDIGNPSWLTIPYRWAGQKRTHKKIPRYGMGVPGYLGCLGWVGVI